MDLERRLAEDKEGLAAQWYDLLLGSYPPETRKVWKAQTDGFLNPVGETLKDATAKLLDLVLQWNDAGAIAGELDRIVKIRAVQDFPPSQALAFVFQLKRLVRDAYMREIREQEGWDALLGFEAKVDNLALMALDLYTKCRQQIYDLRVQEVKNAQRNLLIRAKMIVGDPA